MEYDLSTPFYEDEDYPNKAMFCNESGKYTIDEIEPDENGRRRFKFVEIPPYVPSEQETISQEIATLKASLAKYKEDVEQVELFGMVRADYEQKKTSCKQLVLQLRDLEKRLRELNAAE